MSRPMSKPPKKRERSRWPGSLWTWLRRLLGGRHQDIYDAEYYEFIESSAVWSREAMARSIVRDLSPRTVLDIGCGTGALIDALHGRFVQVTGLEYSDAGL